MNCPTLKQCSTILLATLAGSTLPQEARSQQPGNVQYGTSERFNYSNGGAPYIFKSFGIRNDLVTVGSALTDTKNPSNARTNNNTLGFVRFYYSDAGGVRPAPFYTFFTYASNNYFDMTFTDINNNDIYVGHASEDPSSGNSRTSFVFRNGVYYNININNQITIINGINDNYSLGMIVGNLGDGTAFVRNNGNSQQGAFQCTTNRGTTLGTQANKINNSDTIVGTYYYNMTFYYAPLGRNVQRVTARPFVLYQGQFLDISPPNTEGTDFYGTAINDNNQIVLVSGDTYSPTPRGNSVINNSYIFNFAYFLQTTNYNYNAIGVGPNAGNFNFYVTDINNTNVITGIHNLSQSQAGDPYSFIASPQGAPLPGNNASAMAMPDLSHSLPGSPLAAIEAHGHPLTAAASFGYGHPQAPAPVHLTATFTPVPTDPETPEQRAARNLGPGTWKKATAKVVQVKR